MTFTVWNGGGGGEGGYIILAQMMFGLFAFSIFALISFFTAVLSSFRIRPARWLLVPTMLLAALAAWGLTHSETKATVDTVDVRDVPRLIRSLKTDSGKAWEGDITLLAHLGTDAAPSLIDALQSDDAKTRFGAATALRNMGFRAKPVIRQLTSALKHHDPKVRARVAEALGAACRDNADDEIAIPGLCESLRDNEADVRWQAVGALKWMPIWGNCQLQALHRLSSRQSQRW